MIRSNMAIYHPARRGLAMTFSYTRPLPRILGDTATTRFTTGDRLLVSPLRPLALLGAAVKDFFKA